MGLHLDFACEGCGYTCSVSGQPDAGMEIVTTTISCATCRKLYDVPTARLSGRGLTPVEPACPKTDGRTHQIEPWTHPGPCPRCGEPLAMGEIVALWD